MARDTIYDSYGTPIGQLPLRIEELRAIEQMHQPVRCKCGRIYDLGTVEVTARYADCSMWKTPCCKRVVDDRGETGWTSLKHYERIPKPTADR